VAVKQRPRATRLPFIFVAVASGNEWFRDGDCAATARRMIASVCDGSVCSARRAAVEPAYASYRRCHGHSALCGMRTQCGLLQPVLAAGMLPEDCNQVLRMQRHRVRENRWIPSSSLSSHCKILVTIMVAIIRFLPVGGARQYLPRGKQSSVTHAV
jgi:hypothetical protein